VFGERGEEPDAAVGADPEYLRDDVGGEVVGEAEVEQDDVGLFPRTQLDGVGAGFGVADDGQVGARRPENVPRPASDVCLWGVRGARSSAVRGGCRRGASGQLRRSLVATVILGLSSRS
jgi:hypothetical protein